jgi:hypothetical protein
MVKTASITDAKQSFVEGAGVAPARYKRKVAIADWQTPAASAEAQALYQAKMTDPTVLARRQKKIAKVSNASWQQAASVNGAAIIGQRMSAGADKWATNFTPYLQALGALTLPAKVADPLSNVTNRVGAVVSQMVQTKKSQLGE